MYGVMARWKEVLIINDGTEDTNSFPPVRKGYFHLFKRKWAFLNSEKLVLK